MDIELTATAVKELIERSSSIKDNILFIQYDTEGCGCVVSGVSKLVEKHEITDRDSLAKTTPDGIKVAFEKQYEWAYDEKVIIDFNVRGNTFMLKSPNQILNPRMSFHPLNI